MGQMDTDVINKSVTDKPNASRGEWAKASLFLSYSHFRSVFWELAEEQLQLRGWLKEPQAILIRSIDVVGGTH